MGGAELRVQKVGRVSPPAGTTLDWQVGDLAQAITDLATSGVSSERFPFMEQNVVGVRTNPDGVCVAWFKDPDDHTLSLTQR